MRGRGDMIGGRGWVREEGGRGQLETAGIQKRAEILENRCEQQFYCFARK